MYSRNYYPDSPDRINLPENYDGNAFSQEENSNFTEEAVEASTYEKEGDGESILAGVGKMPLFSGLFGKGGLIGGNLALPKIGTEEIRILATAAFLFFSKNGDRECALILLLLLFIS